jgi:hypothetical protein
MPHVVGSIVNDIGVREADDANNEDAEHDRQRLLQKRAGLDNGSAVDFRGNRLMH